MIAMFLVMALGAPPDLVELFVRPDCEGCRLQQRVLGALKVRHTLRPVSEPAHRAAYEAAAAAHGVAPDPARLPAIRVNGTLLVDDPAWLRVRAHLEAPPAAWSVPRRGPLRVQAFGPAGLDCPAFGALASAGVRVERTDTGRPGAAERLWLTLRLLGHPPRHGTSLPVLLLNDVVMQGCPTVGALAERLPNPAIRATAAVQLWADPAAPTAVLHALNAARALPHAFLSRLRRVGWPADTLATQLGLATSQPVFHADATLAQGAARWRIAGAVSAQDAVRRLLSEHPADLAELLGPEGGAIHVEVRPDVADRADVLVWYAPRVAQPGDHIDARPMRE